MRRPADDISVPARRRGLARIALDILLPLVLLLPSLALYLGMASSMTLGACVVAVVVICAFVAQYVTHPNVGRAARFSIGAVIALLFAVNALHMAIAVMIHPVDLERAALSFVPLTLILLSGYGLGYIFSTERCVDIERAVYLCFALMCAVGLLTVIGYVPPISGTFFKPVFPYTEPSHFALAFLPFLMYTCVGLRGGARVAILLSGLAMGLALESLTLLAGWLLIATICLRRLAIPILAALLAGIATQIDLSYYLDRLDFGSDVQNLSTLVYLQGWQLIAESLTLSVGWGLGFQQLGVQGSNVVASDLIFSILGDNANLLDGSFAFAKLTSEFGALGLLLMFLYIPLAWRSAQSLRHQSLETGNEVPAVKLAQCVVVCFIVELFLRGAGYFSGTTLMLVAAITTLTLRQWANPASDTSVRRRNGPYRRNHFVAIPTNDLGLAEIDAAICKHP